MENFFTIVSMEGSDSCSLDNMLEVLINGGIELFRATKLLVPPAWKHVDTPHFWSGLIAMSRELMPIAGPVPGMPGAWMTAAYHGSGVAMAPYCGELIADLALGVRRLPHPLFMQRSPRRFELGRFRRAGLPAVFAAYGVLDRFGR